MSNVVALAFEQTPVRTVERDGNVWWVLVDVCRVLGVGNPSDVARRLDDDEKGVDTIDTPGGPQQTTIVSEAGLYAVIQQSRKPIARRFDRWVRHDVLPEIRRTGNYIGNPTANVPMQTVQEAVEAAVAPIHAKLDQCLSEQHVMRDTVVRIDRRMDEQRQHSRRYFPFKVVQQFCAFALYEGRKCPVCRDRFVVRLDEKTVKRINSQVHHAINVGVATLETGILLCDECHDDRHRPMPKVPQQSFLLIFHEYQRRLALFVNAQGPLPLQPAVVSLPRYADGSKWEPRPDRKPSKPSTPSRRNLTLDDLDRRSPVVGNQQ